MDQALPLLTQLGAANFNSAYPSLSDVSEVEFVLLAALRVAEPAGTQTEPEPGVGKAIGKARA